MSHWPIIFSIRGSPLLPWYSWKIAYLTLSNNHSLVNWVKVFFIKNAPKTDMLILKISPSKIKCKMHKLPIKQKYCWNTYNLIATMNQTKSFIIFFYCKIVILDNFIIFISTIYLSSIYISVFGAFCCFSGLALRKSNLSMTSSSSHQNVTCSCLDIAEKFDIPYLRRARYPLQHRCSSNDLWCTVWEQ
jgi:hypothetical protein